MPQLIIAVLIPISLNKIVSCEEENALSCFMIKKVDSLEKERVVKLPVVVTIHIYFFALFRIENGEAVLILRQKCLVIDYPTTIVIFSCT